MLALLIPGLLMGGGTQIILLAGPACFAEIQVRSVVGLAEVMARPVVSMAEAEVRPVVGFAEAEAGCS